VKRTLVATSLVVAFLVMWFVAAKAESPAVLTVYPARIPLGIESFRLASAGRDFYLIASVESPNFQGIRRVQDAKGTRLMTSAGQPFQFYPNHLQFRLTASAKEKLLEDRPFPTGGPYKLEELLSSLHFRLKVFHGLEYRYMKPAFVEDIGMPRDVPYDERIYRVGFSIGKIPIEDRVVMEVFSPSGERLCKFHVDLL
jgi:hypothetical protein